MPAMNPRIVALSTPAAHLAVMRVQERLHRENPAGWHAQRPGLKHCPFATEETPCPFPKPAR